MVEPRISAMKRVQVGIVGLVFVLLFVSLANMALDYAVIGGKDDAKPAAKAVAGQALAPEDQPDEALAELGATPVKAEAKAEVAPDQQVPTSQAPVVRNYGNENRVPAVEPTSTQPQ